MFADTLGELSLSLDRALIVKGRDLAIFPMRNTRWRATSVWRRRPRRGRTFSRGCAWRKCGTRGRSGHTNRRLQNDRIRHDAESESPVIRMGRRGRGNTGGAVDASLSQIRESSSASHVMGGQVGTINGTGAPDRSPLAVRIVFSGNSRVFSATFNSSIMVLCSFRLSCVSYTDRCSAGPTCRFRHALGRNRNLPLLHSLDAVDGMHFRNSLHLNRF